MFRTLLNIIEPSSYKLDSYATVLYHVSIITVCFKGYLKDMKYRNPSVYMFLFVRAI